MIEFATINIEKHNQIIDARNKIYKLASDLIINKTLTTKVVTIVSDILTENHQIQPKLQLILGFTKEPDGSYHINILVESTADIYKKYDQLGIISWTYKNTHKDSSFIVIKLKILSEHFVPSPQFIKKEQQALIQQSQQEMFEELQRKNQELSETIQALKSSSQTIQNEKMRALGGMTAGVAHELNSPMMGILNFIQYSIKHTDKKNKIYNVLTDAEREVIRCQDIISNLITFSRVESEGPKEFSHVKLSLLFARVIKLLEYKISANNIQVVSDFPKNEPPLKVKENKIQQVILNLMINAVYALQDCKLKKITCKLEFSKKKAKLSIIDTGLGISETVADKIFEPFFTTKPAGEGTGLGLSVSQSIAKEHRGSLYFNHKQKNGAFRVKKRL